LVLYVPLLVMALGSFLEPLSKTAGSSWTLRWYAEVFSDPVLLPALGRSFIVATSSASIATVLGLIGALALDKWLFGARRPLQILSLVSLMLPELVLALSLLSWFALLGLSLSLVTVVIAHVTLTLPFTILVIGARLKVLDPAFDDAARDLGASEWEILTQITTPLVSPSVFTAFLLAFLLSFDDFLITFYTNGSSSDTLPVRLYSLMKTGLTPKVQALSTLMLLGSTLLIVILTKVRGLKDLH
jgi:spermidine/putrescine transport system permease protein